MGDALDELETFTLYTSSIQHNYMAIIRRNIQRVYIYIKNCHELKTEVCMIVDVTVHHLPIHEWLKWKITSLQCSQV